MTSVSHLLTTVDLGAYERGPDASRLDVDVHLHAVLDTGERTPLLLDRGFTSVLHPGGRIWEHLTGEGLAEDCRAVVGPDGAYGSVTEEESARMHWDALAQDLRERRIEITGEELAARRHDVELSERVLARIGHGR